jgi:Barstar (barnase inhibitor)
MNRADSFDFTDTPSLSAEAFVVLVPAGLTTSEALLQTLYEHARLPGYFGFNWDALSDCLRDLHWIECHAVVLLHADVPKLPLQDLRTYVDVLAECVASWVPGEEHSLKVVFPSAAWLQVASLE